MKFVQSILEEDGVPTTHALTIVPGYGGYFSGVEGVSSFSPGSVCLAVGKQTVTVSGRGLSIGRYFQGDLFISGAISGVSIE